MMTDKEKMNNNKIEAKFYKYTDERGRVFVGVIAPSSIADEFIDYNGNRNSYMNLGFYAISRVEEFLSMTSGAKFYYSGKMMSIPENLTPMTDEDWIEFLPRNKKTEGE